MDVLIRNGKIVDGTGNPWFYGDVLIVGDRIRAVTPPGAVPVEQVGEVVDATGQVVCPGFIDIQSHSIVPLMLDGRSLSKVAQGVTTEIMGEVWTPAPVRGRVVEPIPHSSYDRELGTWHDHAVRWTRFRDWLDALAVRGVTPNVGSFLAGGTLRSFAKGMDMGPASDDERATMRRVVDAAMRDGAFGVSYALIYPPEAYVETDEIVDICRVVSEHGGLYITHLRSEGDRLLEAIDEAIEIGRSARLPVEVYHLKAAGRLHWPKMPDAIARIDAARASGVDLTADMYPYTASGTGLASVLPPWSAAGGKLYDNLRDPAMRARIRNEVRNPTGGWEPMAEEAGSEGVMPVGFERPEHQPYVGKRLSEIAAMRGQDWIDAACDLLAAEGHRLPTIFFSMTEDNLTLQLRQPWIKISTDAGGLDPAWAAAHGPVHPRAYGTYPRVLGRYVREQRVLTLEEAVRKMTSAVADRLGLWERGHVRAGAFADLVLFDAETIADCATFAEPHQLPRGVRDVWINGTRVISRGEHTGALPGRIVHGAGRR